MNSQKENIFKKPSIGLKSITGRLEEVNFKSEFDIDPTEINEANISLQMTAPKITFPSPQLFQVKRSYLDQSKSLKEHDPNTCDELNELSIQEPSLRKCTIISNTNDNFEENIGTISAQYMDECAPTITDDTEFMPIRSIVHTINKSRLYSESESIKLLKAENAELRRKNEYMQNSLQKIESKYQRISQLIDQVPIQKKEDEPIKIDQEVIESIESMTDEAEIENKDIFSKGIMQLFNIPNSEEKQNINEEIRLRKIVKDQKKTIKEYKEFIFKIMGKLEELMDNNPENSVRSFLP